MIDLEKLSREELLEVVKDLEDLEKIESENKILTMFPDTGAYRRELYPKHIDFMQKGNEFKQRALIAGNRVGKTETVLTELVYHLTGDYPHWWKGKTFGEGIVAWVIGVTNESTRDVLQLKLLGMRGEFGTGLIPKSKIMIKKDGTLMISSRSGVPDAAQDVYVKHRSGKTSLLTFKSQVQGWETLQGSAVHFVMFDEEPPYKMYSEALMRTATTGGRIVTTFTPQKGLSEVVLSFLPDGMAPDDGKVSDTKFVANISWDDNPPHLSADEKKQIIDGLLPYEIDAKTRGIPSVGAGKIYPISESDFVMDPIFIPANWPRAYGMDTGWKRTAVIWGAIDPNTDTLYLYDEYYRGQAEPASHILAIQSRGKWISGIIDYAGGAIEDGKRKSTTQQYRDLGLEVYPANKAVDAGLLSVFRRLSEGKLRVFSNCQNWLKEYRIYRRDENGKIVKKDDHLMDATRYLCLSGLDRAEAEPDEFEKFSRSERRDASTSDRSTTTGY
jgi:phage terminase large subunit-like protein